MRVLLVEDDEPIAESLTRGLSRYGFEVRWVRTGAEALADDEEAAIVLVDLGLPDMDGLDVCRELRARGDVPIIVISARSDEVDRVVGLEIGADDYVTKPFGVREVVARMRAVLRRVQPARSEPAQEHGRVRIDRRGRRVHLDGAELELTPKEFDLLSFLAEEPGAVFTREQIMEAVWDENWFGPTKTLDVHVGVLRRKLGDAASLETVRGVGFRLVLT
ncbi:response regulator transcription factor [Lentzea rhizosphaerae]|uniref:Response regulator transcription factor n=1 Tax=Lentzea rhizosphaerae TaxID=2041025 RepID=A0ABV8BVG5_9PSEU